MVQSLSFRRVPSSCGDGAILVLAGETWQFLQDVGIDLKSGGRPLRPNNIGAISLDA